MRIIVGLLNLLLSWITKVPHIEAVPGKAQIVLTRKGVPVANVILTNVMWSSTDGASASFEDTAKYLQNRRFR